MDEPLDSREVEYMPLDIYEDGLQLLGGSTLEDIFGRDAYDVSLFYNRLNDFRIRQKYCDLTIKVEDESFFCHKIILASSSAYFYTLLGGDFREANRDEISLDMMSAKTFKYLLSFMYTNKIRINCNNATDLFVASNFLGLNYVERSSMVFIRVNYEALPIEHALYLLQFSLNTEMYFSTCRISRYLCSDITTTSLSSSFVRISYVALKLILQWVHEHDIGFEVNGEEIVKAIMLWVDHKPDDRKDVLPEIIEMIEFGHSYVPYLEPLKKYAANVDDNKNQMVCNSRSISSDTQLVTRPSSLHVYLSLGNETVTIALNRKSEWKSYSRKTNIRFNFHPDAETNLKRDYDCKKTIVCGKSLFHIYIDPFFKNTRLFFSNLADLYKLTRLKDPPITWDSLDRTGYSLCSVQDRVYLYHINAFKFQPLYRRTNMLVYQTEQDTWISVPAPSATMGRWILASCHKVLYALGTPSKDCPVGGVCRFDDRIPRWDNLPPMCYKNDHIAACECDKKLYVCSETTNEAEVFDPVANRWREIAPRKNVNSYSQFQEAQTSTSFRDKDKHKVYLSMTSYKGLVWILDSNLNLETYDPKTDEWSNFTSPLSGMDEKHNPEWFDSSCIINIDLGM